MYQYEKILKANQINESELPAQIKEAIKKLHELDYDLDEETDDAEIKDITRQLRELDKELSAAITEFADDEAEDDLPADKAKINILHSLYQAGTKKIALKQLKAAGYHFPSASKWIEDNGGFRLKKNLYEDFATLSKL
jgi:hypothetical protein